MEDIKLDISLTLPNDVTFLNTMYFVLIFSLAVFLICALARLLLGKDSSLKHLLTSALGMIMLYAMAVVIYIFSPRDFTYYLNQLPIGTFMTNPGGEQVFVFNTIRNLELPELCSQMLRIYVLAVMINLLGSINYDKLKLLGWVLFRLFMLGLAIVLNVAVFKVVDMFLPFLLDSYAPLILLSFLLISFALGFLKFLIALVLTAVNPVFGGFYAFFFKNKFGKCLSRAIGSTLVICLLLVVFESLGYTTLPIGPEALSGYVPFTVCMFLLWIIVGRVL